MSGKPILIVDDSKTVRKMVEMALKAVGHTVIAASDGMEALEILPRSDFELIITDLNMPNVDGYQLIRTVQENDAYDHIPIIILSSEGTEDDIKTGIDCGASSYLVKPFVARKIQYEVAKYIE